MKRAKTSVKVAIASALAISSTAAIITAAPKMLNVINSVSSESSLYLDVEKVDKDTIKVSLDNVEDIAKALQFSIKLDDNVKLNGGKDGIKDLISEEASTRISNNSNVQSNSIFTDYTYNETFNTIDVIITAENYLPKVGNKIEVFELDIVSKHSDSEKISEVSVTPVEGLDYKYVSNANKEYSGLGVDYNKNPISLNTAPILTYLGEDVISIYDEETINLETIEGLSSKDIDGDEVTLEVRNITNVSEDKEDSQPLIKQFSTSEIGTYTLKIYAVDSNGAKSNPVNILVNVSYNLELEAPTITGVENVTIQSGDIFDVKKGIEATDAKGRSLTVNISGELDTEPEENTEYTLTYSATDKYGKTTAVDRIITVEVNQSPIINGVSDKVVNIGDKFDPMDGVTVLDDKDSNLEDKIIVTGKVNTSVAGEYKLSYSVEDSGEKIGRAQRTVRVNRAPIVSGNDSNIVIEVGTPVTEDMILGGVAIIDETEYTVTVTIPTINKPGTYEAIITVVDSDGAKTIAKRKIVINEKDTEAPMFNYNGETKVEVKQGTDYVVPTITATDKIDGNVEVNVVITKDGKVVDKLDTNGLGLYIITYTTQDSSGNKAELVIEVTVVEADEENPEEPEKPTDIDNITIGDGDGTVDSPIELKVGELATVENINTLISKVSKTHNYEFVGEPKIEGNNKIYKLKLTKKQGVFDRFFNRNVKESYVEIAVPKDNTDVVAKLDGMYEESVVPPVVPPTEDITAPVFNYNGEKNIVIENGTEYKIPAITATDDIDESVDVTIVINKDGKEVNEIDAKIAGVYTVTYTAKDKAGNMSELVIRVTVLEHDNSNPEIPNDEDSSLPDNGGDSGVTPDKPNDGDNSSPDNGEDSVVTPDTPNDEQNSSQNNGTESGDNSDSDLPKTGGVSAAALAAVGAILASTGMVLTKIKKKRKK